MRIQRFLWRPNNKKNVKETHEVGLQTDGRAGGWKDRKEGRAIRYQKLSSPHLCWNRSKATGYTKSVWSREDLIRRVMSSKSVREGRGGKRGATHRTARLTNSSSLRTDSDRPTLREWEEVRTGLLKPLLLVLVLVENDVAGELSSRAGLMSHHRSLASISSCNWEGTRNLDPAASLLDSPGWTKPTS